MAKMCHCKHCQQSFCPRPQNPNQRYCSKPDCQRARKRAWQQQKILADADYRDNQRDANRRWREKNSDYWREYRKKNQEYAARNRERQRQRNLSRNKGDTGQQFPIAKMDSSMPAKSLAPGRYWLSLVKGGQIVKMDALIVEINVLSGG